MTDRQRQLIEAYLPHPRDPELGEDEYYVLDTADRVRKVIVRNLFPHHDFGATYDVYEVSTGRRIDPGWGSVWIGFRRGELYDNKQDCRDRTHTYIEEWEQLRRLQQEEGL